MAREIDIRSIYVAIAGLAGLSPGIAACADDPEVNELELDTLDGTAKASASDAVTAVDCEQLTGCESGPGTFEFVADVSPALPMLMQAGDILEVTVDTESTFTSVERVCFNYTFGAADPLDPAIDTLFSEEYGGFTGVGAPVLSRTLCNTLQYHPDAVARFLDGEDMSTWLLEEGSLLVTGVTVSVTGDRVCESTGRTRRLRIAFRGVPTTAEFTAIGFATIDGVKVPGRFPISDDRPLRSTVVALGELVAGDTVEITGAFQVPGNDPGDKRVDCPPVSIAVISPGRLECGPVRFVYSARTGTCRSVCN